ncbi:MAG: hypothetical protein F4X92_04260 [Gammaproteobacteria bacterium]|nr:hypothetical protein [Gammaproteobacteria bacterium]
MNIVERTCTFDKKSVGQGKQAESKPLGEYRDTPAYVLLGDPGSGKTTAFVRESEEQQDAVFVSARDMVTFDVDDRPEWQNKTLFIDGLDEIRAGLPDFRTPFDRLRAALDKLGCPCFRISCREADWFGALDQEHLQTVSPDSKVLILHLDPLTENDIKHILPNHLNETDAGPFIEEAGNRGLGQLLANPLTLDLLAKAVDSGEWPTTRKEAFEQACRILSQEYNPEHSVGTGSQVTNPDQLLDTAGYLCAIQLMAGNAGYALSIVVKTSEFPFIEEIDDNDISFCRKTARTRLFKVYATGQVEPVHRHIAEYLAARHLSQLINGQGMPLGRILALITGEDGIVISGLRGLSAWLAVFCIGHRREIINRDPLGVVLYGDVRQFSRDDKRYLIHVLHKEARRYPGFRISHWKSSPFGSIATPDMENEFRHILTAPDRDSAYQEFALCVLDAMLHGDRISGLDDVLMDIVRTADWGLEVRFRALEVICRADEAGTKNMSRMKLLLDEINRGVIEDPMERLMGFLLMQLYPGIVTPETVFDYLHPPDDPGFIGFYTFFWSQILHEQSSEEDVKTLLDQIASRADIASPIPGDFPLFKKCMSNLLERGVNAHGTSIETNRLHEWLGIGPENHWHRRESVRNWLGDHPEIQKKLIAFWKQNCRENEHFDLCMHRMQKRLYEAKPPVDYGLWCLGHLSASSSDEVAEYWLKQSVNAISNQQGNAGLSLDEIGRAVENNGQHRDLLEKMLFCPVDDEDQAFYLSQDRQERQKREERRRWLKYVKSQRHSLRQGTAHPRLLYDLASAYFGLNPDVEGKTSSEQLLHLLGCDENLVECALEGFRRSIYRDDVPDAEEIFLLSTKNEEHWLGRAWLAGMVENTRINPDFALGLSDGPLRIALAFYLDGNFGSDKAWFDRSLESRPEAIAETLIHYVSVTLGRKSGNIKTVRYLMNKLAFEPEYASVARQAIPAMLKSFPARCNNEQLELLYAMLISAMKYLEMDTLRTQIEDKLNLSSMNAPQRVCWLVAGLVVSPEFFEKRLTEFMEGNESRVRHFAKFLSFERQDWLPLNDLPVSTVRLLVEILGRYFAPYSLKGVVLASSAIFTAEIIERMIHLLASDASLEAAETLVSLSENGHLEKWRHRILDARFNQRTVRREACFRHPNIDQVVSTLKNSTPANAGDLAALALDVLDDMARRIRDGNTDDYNQFWNEATSDSLATPKHEELCRDALLSDLQQRLAPWNIEAQPEGHYAEDKRADIRISFGGSDGPAIPLEIKKNSHPDLWKAIRNQLIECYAKDDRAAGYGIYVVFWFGFSNKMPLSPKGRRPRRPEELADSLREDLTDEEKRKISVCVIDVTSPCISKAAKHPLYPTEQDITIC